MKLKISYLNNPYTFSLSFILLHALTYALYFKRLNSLEIDTWINGSFVSPLALVILPKTNIPNLAGIFLILYYIAFKDFRKKVLITLTTLFLEHSIISFDIMGEFDSDIPKAYYYLLYSKLDFVSDNYRIGINFSIILSILFFIQAYYLRKKNVGLGRNLQFK